MVLCENFKQTRIAFIGCGNMASAILGGLVEAGWPESNIIASNNNQTQLDSLANKFAVQTTQSNTQAVEFAQVVVLAVKPQILAEVCAELSNIDLSEKLIISIAAGFPTHKISEQLQQTPSIVRAMPNTPALIGCGATGLYPTAQVSSAQKALTGSIFDAVGTSCWIESEADMDVVTAISGSSPAYFFLMMQAMLEQAVASGIDKNTAHQLITQSALGAAKLAQENSHQSLEELRQQVTSPGGTTAAAIDSFINADFENIAKNAVLAAIDRGKELGARS